MQESFIPDCDNYYGPHNSYLMQIVFVLGQKFVQFIRSFLGLTRKPLKWKNDLS